MQKWPFVRFTPVGMDPFYGYWQSAPSGPTPLLVHTPGCHAWASAHSGLVVAGHNVLHANPLGRITPDGAGQTEMRDGWRAAGLVDGLSHVRRLTVPVMLTGGGADVTCPSATVESLFHCLPSTTLYCLLDGQGHENAQPFMALLLGWFRMYA